MKKFLYVLIIVATGIAANAQIVLTRSDFATAGQRYKMTTDTVYELQANFRDTGTGKVWRLDTAVNKDYYYISRYLDPSTTPSGSYYPTSDLAYQEDSTEDFMYYLKTSTSEMRILGGSDTTDPTSNVTFRAFIFPLQMRTTWADTNEIMQVMESPIPGTDSLKIEGTVIFHNVVDGEGSLHIVGLTTNALRLHRTIYTNLTISTKIGSFPYIPVGSENDSSDAYEFVASGGGSWIARMDQNDADEYTLAFRDLWGLSVKKTFASAGFRVYPNPSQANLNIDVKDKAATYNLMNLTGSTVMNGQLSQGVNTLNTEGLANGVYLLRIVNSQGESFTEKIILQ